MGSIFTPFPPSNVAVRVLVAVGCGLLVGLEREWSQKEFGSRTFPIVSLLGALAALISPGFEVAGFAGVIALLGVAAIRNLLLAEGAETTTAAALMATFALGVLAGEGHVFTPAAAAILMTLMLSLKPQLSRFALGLNAQEVRGAVLLALIAFVIYPVLPNSFVDPWGLFNPRQVWLTIVLISSIGFVNYVLLRLYSTRGLYYAAVFGGLVNSTAAVAEIAQTLSVGKENAATLTVVNLLTVISMFVRNLVLVAIFSPAASLLALGPILVMVGAAGGWMWRKPHSEAPAAELKLGSPLELKKVGSLGSLFIAIQVSATLGERLIGQAGIVIVSLFGGLVSSASATAAAAILASHGNIPAWEAALCTVLASIASMLSNIPIVHRQVHNRQLLARLSLSSAVIALAGGAVLAGEFFLGR